MRTVAFHTLGCKLNFSETSTIARMFEERGYQKVEMEEGPDVFILNTCSVTEQADRKCRQVISKVRNNAPNSFVCVMGCFAQLKPKEISQIPGVNAVLGASEKFKLFELLEDFTQKEHVQICASEISSAHTFHAAYSIGDRTRTFLKVQDGCDYHCSFCTIPLARGGSRSDTLENILKAVDEIEKGEVKEVVLTGVNTGDYGLIDGERKHTFFELIQILDKKSGIERFRISSIEPNLLSDEIIAFVATSNRFMPHFHIPLQSGSDKVLQFMRRKYKTDLYRSRILKIKELMPHACIGVDVIVGFPGETEDVFLETYNFLQELDISYLHVFPYSERVNTKAAEMHSKVSAKDKERRSKMLRILSEKKKRAFYETQLNSKHLVLWESEVKQGKIFGYSENYLRFNKDVNTSNSVTIEECTAKTITDLDGLSFEAKSLVETA